MEPPALSDAAAAPSKCGGGGDGAVDPPPKSTAGDEGDAVPPGSAEPKKSNEPTKKSDEGGTKAVAVPAGEDAAAAAAKENAAGQEQEHEHPRLAIDGQLAAAAPVPAPQDREGDDEDEYVHIGLVDAAAEEEDDDDALAAAAAAPAATHNATRSLRPSNMGSPPGPIQGLPAGVVVVRGLRPGMGIQLFQHMVVSNEGGAGGNGGALARRAPDAGRRSAGSTGTADGMSDDDFMWLADRIRQGRIRARTSAVAPASGEDAAADEGGAAEITVAEPGDAAADEVGAAEIAVAEPGDAAGETDGPAKDATEEVPVEGPVDEEVPMVAAEEEKKEEDAGDDEARKASASRISRIVAETEAALGKEDALRPHIAALKEAADRDADTGDRLREEVSAKATRWNRLGGGNARAVWNIDQTVLKEPESWPTLSHAMKRSHDKIASHARTSATLSAMLTSLDSGADGAENVDFSSTSLAKLLQLRGENDGRDGQEDLVDFGGGGGFEEELGTDVSFQNDGDDESIVSSRRGEAFVDEAPAEKRQQLPAADATTDGRLEGAAAVSSGSDTTFQSEKAAASNNYKKKTVAMTNESDDDSDDEDASLLPATTPVKRDATQEASKEADELEDVSTPQQRELSALERGLSNEKKQAMADELSLMTENRDLQKEKKTLTANRTSVAAGRHSIEGTRTKLFSPVGDDADDAGAGAGTADALLAESGVAEENVPVAPGKVPAKHDAVVKPTVATSPLAKTLVNEEEPGDDFDFESGGGDNDELEGGSSVDSTAMALGAAAKTLPGGAPSPRKVSGEPGPSTLGATAVEGLDAPVDDVIGGVVTTPAKPGAVADDTSSGFVIEPGAPTSPAPECSASKKSNEGAKEDTDDVEKSGKGAKHDAAVEATGAMSPEAKNTEEPSDDFDFGGGGGDLEVDSDEDDALPSASTAKASDAAKAPEATAVEMDLEEAKRGWASPADDPQLAPAKTTPHQKSSEGAKENMDVGKNPEGAASVTGKHTTRATADGGDLSFQDVEDEVVVEEEEEKDDAPGLGGAPSAGAATTPGSDQEAKTLAKRDEVDLDNVDALAGSGGMAQAKTSAPGANELGIVAQCGLPQMIFCESQLRTPAKRHGLTACVQEVVSSLGEMTKYFHDKPPIDLDKSLKFVAQAALTAINRGEVLQTDEHVFEDNVMFGVYQVTGFMVFSVLPPRALIGTISKKKDRDDALELLESLEQTFCGGKQLDSALDAVDQIVIPGLHPSESEENQKNARKLMKVLHGQVAREKLGFVFTTIEEMKGLLTEMPSEAAITAVRAKVISVLAGDKKAIKANEDNDVPSFYVAPTLDSTRKRKKRSILSLAGPALARSAMDTLVKRGYCAAGDGRNGELVAKAVSGAAPLSVYTTGAQCKDFLLEIEDIEGEKMEKVVAFVHKMLPANQSVHG